MNENSYGGGKVSFNSEVNTYLERVQSFLDTQKYQDAVALFKVISEKYSDEMLEVRPGLYYPIKANIQERIKKLPQQAYDLYMTEINSLAKSYYEKGLEGDVHFWKDLIENFFISDYAGKACEGYADYLLDKGSFALAIKYYDLAQTSHMKTITDKKVMINKIYAYVMSFQLLKAKALLKKMQDNKIGISYQPLLGKLISSKEDEMSNELAKKHDSLYAGGTMQTWVDLFQINFEFEIGKKPKTNNRIIRNRMIVRDGDFENEVEEDVDTLRKEWVDNLWYPVNQLCINDDHYIYKKEDILFCYDAITNEKKWEVKLDLDSKNSNDLNHHTSVSFGRQRDLKKVPTSEIEVSNFSDQIGSQVGLVNGILFTIIGHESTGQVAGGNGRFWSRGNQQSLAGSMLYGVNPTTGKKVFRLGHNSNKDEHFNNIVFLSLPVFTPGGNYGVIYNKGSSLYMSLVDKRGKGIWNKEICSYEDSYLIYTNNAKAFFENGYFFISTGYGLVAKIESETGKYVWASKYSRFIEANNRQNYFTEKPGFEVNDIFVKNGVVYIAPPDSKQIFGFDAETGEIVLKTNEDLFSDFSRYLIGFHNSGIITCGERGLSKFSYETLTQLWTSEISKIHSRPTLENDSVIVPSLDQVYILNANSGIKQKKFNIKQSDEKFILGNVYLINNLLVSICFDSVTLCGSLESRITFLTEKIKDKSDKTSLLNRGDLYFKLKDYSKSIIDYFGYLIENPNSDHSLDVKEKIIQVLYAAGETGEDDLIVQYMSKTKDFGDRNEIFGLYSYLIRHEVSKSQYNNVISYFKEVMIHCTADNSRMLLSNDGLKISPWVFSLNLISNLIKSNAKLKEEFYSFLLEDPSSVKLSFLIQFFDLSDDTMIKRKLLNLFFDSTKEHQWNAKSQMFYRYLSTSKDPEFQAIGTYLSGVLLLEIGSYSEYYKNKDMYQNAFKKLPSWMNSNVMRIQVDHDLLDQIESLGKTYKPENKIITDPPMNRVYEIEDRNFKNSILKLAGLGADDRSEFLEKKLFYLNEFSKDLICVDLFSGNEVWKNNFDVEKLSDIKKTVEDDDDDENVEYMNAGSNNNAQYVDMSKRSRDLATMMIGKSLYVVDLITGKKAFKLQLGKDESFLNMTEEMLLTIDNSKNEVSAHCSSDGQIIWSRILTESIGAIKSNNKFMVVLDEYLKKVTVINLKNGSIVVQKELANSVDSLLHLEDESLIYFSRGKMYNCELSSMNVKWSINKYLYNGWYDDKGTPSLQSTNKFFYIRTNMSEVVKIAKETGVVEWSIKVPPNSNEHVVNYCVTPDEEYLYVERKLQYPKTYPASSYLDIYLAKDGSKIHEMSFTVGSGKENNIIRRNSFALFDYALSGEVVPVLARDNNKVTISFYKKKTGLKSGVFELVVDSFSRFENAFFKSSFIFLRSRQKILAYANSEYIDVTLRKMDKIRNKYIGLKQVN